MIDLKHTPVKVWSQKIDPQLILKWTSVFNIGAYFIFMIFSIVVAGDDNKPLPSMSAMIAYNHITTITFTILVFIHGYTIMTYLVIISEYIGFRTVQFKFISIASLLYWFSLILVSYLPVNVVKNPHNIFAVTSFFFSTCTVYLHKHTFMVTHFGQLPTFDFSTVERHLIISEVIMIFVITILAILFWTNNIIIAEYLFVALILVDKYFKVYILEQSGLLKIDDAFLEYRYYSPPNNPTTGVEIFQTQKF